MGTLTVAIIVGALIAVGIIMLVLGKQAKKATRKLLYGFVTLQTCVIDIASGLDTNAHIVLYS